MGGNIDKIPLGCIARDLVSRGSGFKARLAGIVFHSFGGKGCISGRSIKGLVHIGCIHSF